jgi:hypothetical protein
LQSLGFSLISAYAKRGRVTHKSSMYTFIWEIAFVQGELHFELLFARCVGIKVWPPRALWDSSVLRVDFCSSVFLVFPILVLEFPRVWVTPDNDFLGIGL